MTAMTQSAETRYKDLKLLATTKLKPDEEPMALRPEGEAEGEWPGHQQATRAEGRGDQEIEGEEGASWSTGSSAEVDSQP
ncbi:hypothetical protein Zm00014a_036427 [Zea mays]|jgi:hypothetical protein|uniref:Uncharacterized protein n=2 Tax=Zea mays TaxID=4577 RepID=K7TYG8_MAIZE|nr:hypothetical protein ZEAMMB73_Zm00001d049946 [Zea mays]PWZ26150.1 hypothetical protein Zm00014a_036427 [Zea mays]